MVEESHKGRIIECSNTKSRPHTGGKQHSLKVEGHQRGEKEILNTESRLYKGEAIWDDTGEGKRIFPPKVKALQGTSGTE